MTRKAPATLLEAELTGNLVNELSLRALDVNMRNGTCFKTLVIDAAVATAR